MQHLHRYLRSYVLEQSKDILPFFLHLLIDGMFKNETALLDLNERLIRGGVQVRSRQLPEEGVLWVVDTLEILTDQEDTREKREKAGLLLNLSALQTFSFFCFL